MQAIRVHRFGGLEALVAEDVPRPVPGDGEVGRVTTALWSPRLERNIGYAWLPIGLASDGTSVQVSTPDGERQATVVPMPFVDPGKQIPKADPAIVR